MPVEEIIITGKAETTYDLEELATKNTRMSSNETLLIHVHEYSEGEDPNPENPTIGQIWLSKKV